MSLISRLLFVLITCLLLSNCGLIGTALRLAPMALMFADNEKIGVRRQSLSTIEARGREVVSNGSYANKINEMVVLAPQVVSR